MKEQRRLAAIVSADIVGYSRLMGQDESGTLSALKAHRRELIDPAIAAHGGRIVKTTGDGMLLEFPSVVDAVRCMVEVQTAMAARNAEVASGKGIEFRIGVNIGDIILDEDDIFGDGVNVAARLQAIAAPGGVCVSSRVHEDVRDRLELHFEDRGEHALKNIARPVRVYQWTPAGRAAAAGHRAGAVRKPPARAILAGAAALTLALGAAGWWWYATSSTPPRPPAEIATPAPPAPSPPAVPAPARASVAVLPFVNQSGDAAQEYFSDGLTEDVIAAIGRFRSLTVMSRNAVFPYKGKNLKPAEIGRELDVRYIVEGSARRAGERIRINALLSEAASGRLLWSQQYDEAQKDVFAVQDSVARQVAGALAVNVTLFELQHALAKPTENLDAFDLVLRGRARLGRFVRADNREARQLLEQAIRLDPRYAAAYAWHGRAHLNIAEFGWTEDPAAAVDRAMELAKKALEFDPDSAIALAAIGAGHAIRGEFDLALEVSDRMLALNPSDAESLFGRANALLWLGRFDESVEASEYGVRLDPYPSSNAVIVFGLAHYEARRHPDAVRVLERGVARFPDDPFIHAILAAAYAQSNRMPEAAQAADAVRRLHPLFSVEAFGSRFQNPAHHAYLKEGLIKAGLN